MKTGLVLEGGALRTIFSTGVCDAFLDGGLPLPDYTVGVSAGIAYGVKAGGIYSLPLITSTTGVIWAGGIWRIPKTDLTSV